MGGLGTIALGVFSTWGITKIVYKIKLGIYNSKVTTDRREEDNEEYATGRSKGGKSTAMSDANGNEEETT